MRVFSFLFSRRQFSGDSFRSFCLGIFSLVFFSLSLPAPARAQAPADLPPETVIAEVEGKSVTAGDLQNFIGSLPPQLQQSIVRDRKTLVQNYALMLRLSQLAEKDKLDQATPYKEMLEAGRMNLLANALLSETGSKMPLTEEEQKKFYEATQSQYAQVKLKVIYVTFAGNSPAPAGKKPRTEAEAKTKVEALVKQARSGADFVKLVKENSEDETSLEKAGDFGTLRRSDNVPAAIRDVVFKLKAGEISEPVRQPNGFYVFRAEETSAVPLEEVRAEIQMQLRQQKMREWLDGLSKNMNLKFVNEAFFAPAPAQQAPNAPPASAPKGTPPPALAK
jgi:peptidyl-prolyl cis-trans isomerase C